MFGLSPVNNNVITIVFDTVHWSYINQIIKLCKPIVDAIGNLESHNATLADCILEMIRCAKDLNDVEIDADDDPEFFRDGHRSHTPSIIR
jgi:hypothetical protein